MKTEFIVKPPPPPLDRYVQCLWIARGPSDPTPSKVLPNGVVELIINLGDRQKVIDHDTPKEEFYTRSWIAGLQHRYIIIQSETDTDLVGIRFRPGGAHPFFGLPLSELTDRVLEYDLVLRRQMESLRDRLWHTQSATGRFSIVERFLLDWLPTGYNRHPAVDSLLHAFEHRRGPLSIGECIRATGYSHKHIAALFRRYVGTTPKYLLRIARFQNAVRLTKDCTQVDWQDIVHALHYYDQSHLIADFRLFAGCTPEAYLRMRTPDENHTYLDDDR